MRVNARSVGDVLSGKDCPGSVHAKLEADIQTLPTMFDTALFKGQMLEFHFQVRVCVLSFKRLDCILICPRGCLSCYQSVAIPCVLSRIRHTIGKAGEPVQKKPK
jgi:hypothetical protein